MNRTQKFALNSITAAIAQVIALIVGFITPRLMIFNYGSEINGLINSLNQFISYISLVEAGISGAAVFALYKPLTNMNTFVISSIIVSTKKCYRQVGYIFSSGVLLLALLYALFCNIVTVSKTEVFLLTLLLGINGCIDFFFLSGYRVILTADQRNYVISSMTVIQTILRTIIICALMICKVNIIVLYSLAIVPVFLKCILILLYCRKKYTFLDNNVPEDKSALNKRWDVIYQQILGVVQNGTPTIIATILLDFVQISVYSIYNMIISGINGLLNIFVNGLPAGFGELIARGENEKLVKTVSEFEVVYYFILTIIYGVSMVMMLPFLSVYTAGVTDANYYSPILVFVIVLNGLLYNIKTPQSMLVVSAGMYRETRWRVTIQGIIIILMGILFGILFGLPGIILGSCVSNIYRIIDLLIFVPNKILHNNSWVSCWRMLRVVLNISIIYIPSLFFEISVDGYLQWFLGTLIYTLYSVIVAILSNIIFDKKDFSAVLKRINNVLLKKM